MPNRDNFQSCLEDRGLEVQYNQMTNYNPNTTRFVENILILIVNFLIVNQKHNVKQMEYTSNSIGNPW